jgi:hypothetical protein
VDTVLDPVRLDIRPVRCSADNRMDCGDTARNHGACYRRDRVRPSRQGQGMERCPRRCLEVPGPQTGASKPASSQSECRYLRTGLGYPRSPDMHRPQVGPSQSTPLPPSGGHTSDPGRARSLRRPTREGTDVGSFPSVSWWLPVRSRISAPKWAIIPAPQLVAFT